MHKACHYRVSVKGLVTNSDGHILLALEDNGLWDIPGGGLEHQEDPIVGLKREIHEETGLEVVDVSEAPIYFLTAKRLGSTGYTANIIYDVKLKNLDFTPSEECLELRFWSVAEIQKIPVYPNVTKLLSILS